MSARGGTRGQSIQVGAVILFGTLIVLFSMYQATIVPSQNREVEFNHNQRVQGDMLELRNVVLSTYVTGDTGYTTVELGTEFPARLIALNPSPPSGSIFTTELRPIEVEQAGSEITADVCPGTDPETRFIQYTPSYAQFSGAGTLTYDNTVLHHDFGDESYLLTDQELVDGNTVTLAAIQASFSEGGTRSVAIEPEAGNRQESTREDINVTVPTTLSESDWETALEGAVDPENVTVTSGAAGRNLTVNLTGEITIDCGPVGVSATPPTGSRSSSADDLNPASPGDIVLSDETTSGSTVTVTFNNTGGTNNFTEGRINFYESQGGGGGPTSADIFAVGEADSATLPVGGDYQTFDPVITLEGNNTETDVGLDFDQNPNTNEWFIVTLKLESGETAKYFVPAN